LVHTALVLQVLRRGESQIFGPSAQHPLVAGAVLALVDAGLALVGLLILGVLGRPYSHQGVWLFAAQFVAFFFIPPLLTAFFFRSYRRLRLGQQSPTS
jgi:hypothetical protein